jgi:hypothetical protein
VSLKVFDLYRNRKPDYLVGRGGLVYFHHWRAFVEAYDECWQWRLLPRLQQLLRPLRLQEVAIS